MLERLARLGRKPKPPPYDGPRLRVCETPLVFLGNCQARGLGRLAAALTGNPEVAVHELLPEVRRELDAGGLDAALEHAGLVFLHDVDVREALQQRRPDLAGKLRMVPGIAYGGFHPDCDYVFGPDGVPVSGPLQHYQSSIVFLAWQQGLDRADTRALFRAEVYELLGFHEQAAAGADYLRAVGRACDLPMEPLLDRWSRRGAWMYSVNHPRLFVLEDIARALLAREGLEALPGLGDCVWDELMSGAVWPVYPELAARLGLEHGSLAFKLPRAPGAPLDQVLALGLEDFIDLSFAVYDAYPREALRSGKAASERYRGLLPALAARRAATVAVGAAAEPAAPAPRHPYEALPDERYWRRAVAGLDPAQVDPVGPGFPLRIAPGERVASAGSCFAQHLSRALEAAGVGYLVTEEAPPGLSPAEAAARQYRIYSARYGNVYTARQLRQLFERAFGRFTPLEEAWARDDGRWVDPFRPQIEPEGFDSLEALRAARDDHLAAVRRMFEQLDVLVFTLGLTEAWADRRDGAVFPLAPGVAGGRHDPARHVFHNARVAEVVDDLRGFLRGLREVNPRSRLLLTVSPVPLVATAEPRHVLVSTAASKAVLRAAAQEIADGEPGCAYFPSYELVTGPQQCGGAFEADLRSVRPEAVEQVMRLFLRHCAPQAAMPGAAAGAAPGAAPAAAADAAAAPSPAAPAAPGEALQAELRELGRIICDEEALDAASAR